MRHCPTPLLLIGLILTLSTIRAGAATAPTASIWDDYAHARANDREPVLADFSHAGYRRGEVELPAPDSKIFRVTDYGAVPNDELSDKAAIMKAVAAAELNGAGIIFFSPGRFLVNEPTDNYNEPIRVSSSNIVFRGSGRGPGGTELFMAHHMDPRYPGKKWSSPYLIQFRADDPVGVSTTVVANAGRETFRVEVADASLFVPDDWVYLNFKSNDPAVVRDALAPYEPDPDWSKIINDGVRIEEYHQVRSIEGNTLEFFTPIHADIDARYTWNLKRIQPLQEVGFENIHFAGNWHEPFVHHKSAIHNGGWSMLELRRCVNSWVRNCRFSNVSRAVYLKHSAHVTVTNVVVDGNLGHNCVSVASSTHCLIHNVEDRAGQWHSFGVEGTSVGNVFLHSTYPEHTSYESHADQSRWNLFDNITGGWIYMRWGGALFNQPNHLHGLVLWNYKKIGKGEPGEFHFMVPGDVWGRTIMPYVIGFHGVPQEWARGEIAVLESNGVAVEPSSLYVAQFRLRTGRDSWIIVQD